ncbi:MAG: hypothetical protein COW30_16065 [Rhodospirillales bacterium CG15_BIG_FIL_POST_REV_8_21_14_020_66_15]|nr:MAG: hypothetical protein COW30_16065 [Rhodospirillales bacterium CG15_BIG_FIL_POST_REV_8_21_14_020_66_15]
MITVYVDPERARANPLPKFGEPHFYESIDQAADFLRRAGVTGEVRVLATPEAIKEYKGHA